MFKSLQRVQTGADSRLQNVEIYLFGKCVQVDLLCPILFIAVDTPAADKLCGHYSSYSEGVQHVTCSCDIPFSELDDPLFLERSQPTVPKFSPYIEFIPRLQDLPCSGHPSLFDPFFPHFIPLGAPTVVIGYPSPSFPGTGLCQSLEDPPELSQHRKVLVFWSLAYSSSVITLPSTSGPVPFLQRVE